MHKFISVFISFTFLFYFSPAFAQNSITVEGTGDNQKLLRRLAKAYQAKYPGKTIVVPNSIGSGGGIKALAAGKTDLARTARPLKKRETQYGFKSKIFAYSPVVVVVHPSVVGIKDITNEQLNQIYSGKILQWDNLGGVGKIYVANREEGDSSRIVLEKNIPGFKDITEPVGEKIYSTPDTLRILTSFPNTIGYISATMAKGSILKILSINRIAPTTENILSKKYKLVSPYAIVWRPPLKGLANHFVDYLFTEPAQKIISDFGAVPANN